MRTYRLSWWLTFWGLLTSLSLNWVLPALDHHAAEYNPFHAHAVVGGSAAQRKALLVAHGHGAGHPHDHREATTPAAGVGQRPGAPILVSLSTLEGVRALAAHAAEVLAAMAAPLPLPPQALWLTVGVLPLILLWTQTRPPINPPRRAP